MRRICSARIRVIGILNVVFGAIGVLCLFLATGSAVHLRAANSPGPNGQNLYEPMFDVLDREIPHLFIIQFWSGILSMALACMLLIGGISLLGMRHWGRILSVIACIGIVVIQTASITWILRVVDPVMERVIKPVQDEIAKVKPSNAQAQVTEVEEIRSNINKVNAFVVVKLALIIFCMTIIVMLLRPSVNAAFTVDRGLAWS
jgi:hypothetical protein